MATHSRLLLSVLLFLQLTLPVKATTADVERQLQLFEQAAAHELLPAANAFFGQLLDDGQIDEPIVFEPATPADTLREQVWYWAADYYYGQQLYKQSERYALLALPLFHAGDDATGEADCLSLLSITYTRMGNYQKAASYAKQCYRLDEASGDADRMAVSLNTLAAIYVSARQPQLAEPYINKGLQIATGDELLPQRAVLLGMASEMYHAMGRNEQALDYANQAYELEQQLGRPHRAMLRLSQKAEALIGLHHYAQAEELLRQVIPFYRQVGDQQSLGIASNQLGMALLGQLRHDEAAASFRQAAAILFTIGDKFNEMHARKGLFESLWKSHPDSARVEMERFNALKDSLYDSASAESLARYNAEFGNDWLKQANEAERSARHRAIFIMAAIVLLLLLAAAAIGWMLYRRQRRQAALNQQLSTNIEELQKKFEQLSTHYDNALSTVGGSSPQDDKGLSEADRDFLDRATAIINERLLSGQATAELVASQMNMSLFQFRQRLSAITGETPQAFIANERMRRARQLLDHHPELNISEVALLCAYNDTPNFTRAFKKTFGVTPTQYQERKKV